MILGCIYSSTRKAIKRPAIAKGKTLYIYPEQYEGQDYDSLLFCTEIDVLASDDRAVIRGSLARQLACMLRR